MITLGVTDLDNILARLDAHGIGHEPVETYGNGVRHVEVLDPDGNSLSLAETPARLPGLSARASGPGRTGQGLFTVSCRLDCQVAQRAEARGR
jgi:hypothetical protein